MASKLFYNDIIPLNRDKHRTLHIDSSKGDASFAEHTHYVPLAASEFYQASKDYPILFAGEGDSAGAIALLGLRENENLFVSDDKRWIKGTYVPAFVRRYPFILARNETQSDFTICFDQSYAGFSDDSGDALFDEEGKESSYLGGVIDFLNRYTRELEMTAGFVSWLQEHDLLATRTLRVSDRFGRNFFLNDFRVVDEEKLAKLEDNQLGELHKKGWLGLIYAHLISLGCITRLPEHLEPPEETVEDITIQ
ncbi:SapC family protein [Marinobacterium sediminicola]|uniref:SapC protein n=1 Tax=Marinobacterium sediminicola TaxID=518898 RepID=A0ABY1S198_9GAMM|nr:SapC family protein [Marinobacterium sediminicola]ULG69837.1 SapC family protein [Marinobacterium sediminicola]SMR75348.1 SapC protein [Marinobacterium sediminicola]